MTIKQPLVLYKHCEQTSQQWQRNQNPIVLRRQRRLSAKRPSKIYSPNNWNVLALAAHLFGNYYLHFLIHNEIFFTLCKYKQKQHMYAEHENVTIPFSSSVFCQSIISALQNKISKSKWCENKLNGSAWVISRVKNTLIKCSYIAIHYLQNEKKFLQAIFFLI